MEKNLENVIIENLKKYKVLNQNQLLNIVEKEGFSKNVYGINRIIRLLEKEGKVIIVEHTYMDMKNNRRTASKIFKWKQL